MFTLLDVVLRVQARIQKAGGCVVHFCGGPRVMGVLAMSRAIGDTWLQRFGLIATPEVSLQVGTYPPLAAHCCRRDADLTCCALLPRCKCCHATPKMTSLSSLLTVCGLL